MFSISFQNIFKNVSFVFKRFPLAVLSSLLLTAILLNVQAWQAWRVEVLAAIFALGILFFVGSKLVEESHKINGWIVLSVSLVGFGLLARYLYHTYAFFFPCLQLFLALLLWIMIIPHIGKDRNQDSIWVYNYQLWSHFLFSVLISLILLAGIFVILSSLSYLFNLSFIHDQYLKVTIIIGCFILPMLVMAGIPKYFDDKGTSQQGKGIQRLADFVLAPLVLILGFIIVSYAIKILIAQSLPRGNVGYLVSALGGVGSFTYILGDKSKVMHSKIYQFFRKYFFLIMIAPLVLMAIGLWSRIHEYGLTQARYLVVLMFTWMTLFVLHAHLFNREKLSRFMMISAAGLLFFTSFGSWGCNELSVYSQTHRLQTILKRNSILVNGKIHQLHSSVTREDEAQIHSSLVYLHKQKRIKDLQPWFEPDHRELFDETKYPIILVSDLTKALGLGSSEEVYEDSFNIMLHEKWEGWKSLWGYDYIYQNFQLPNYHEMELKSQHSPLSFPLPPYNGIELIILFDVRSQEFSIKNKNNQKPLLTVNMSTAVQKYWKEDKSANNKKVMVFEGEDETLKILVNMDAISGKFNEKGNPEIRGIRCDLYAKKKTN